MIRTKCVVVRQYAEGMPEEAKSTLLDVLAASDAAGDIEQKGAAGKVSLYPEVNSNRLSMLLLLSLSEFVSVVPPDNDVASWHKSWRAAPRAF